MTRTYTKANVKTKFHKTNQVKTHFKNKQNKQVSQFFREYSQTLKGVSVKDCLTKYKQQLRASKINFNENCFQSQMSMVIIKHSITYQMVTLFVSFSHFSFQISAINLSKESLCQAHLEILGRGTYGKVYQTKINNENVAIKSIQYFDDFASLQKQKNNKELSTISKAIFEYCLKKLFSVFEIGPKMINIFGFDLLISKNTIQFSMQKCEKNQQKLFQYLYSSLDLMHSLGIIHGDIKPDNIMWSPSFQKWVFIDFGLSKVLRQKPGEKTFTKYFGTFQNSSTEMKNLFHSSNSQYVDLYYNDLFGINAVFNGFVSEVIKRQKQKIVSSVKPYVNFIENSQLCYAFYAFQEDNFNAFCVQLTKTFTLLDQFWNIIKSIDIYQRTIRMLLRLSSHISDPENLIRYFITSYTKQYSRPTKKQINFLWRFQQRAIEFNGAINDVMLFSLIYYNRDISPLRFCQKQVLLKTLINQFDPLNSKCWKYLLKLLKNPYVISEEVAVVFENVKNILGIKDWIKCELKQNQLHEKGRQIAGACIAKYGFNLFELNSKEYLSDVYIYRNEEKITNKIFQFAQFSNIIKLYENEFPYLQFLGSLQNNLEIDQFVSHFLSNLQRMQQKYKIKDIPISIKFLKGQLERFFTINSNSEIQKFTSLFGTLPTLEFLISSNNIQFVQQSKRILKDENKKEHFENIFKQIKSRCFISIFCIQYSVESFFEEHFECGKLMGYENNFLETLIRSFYENFQKFIPLRDYQSYYLIDNLNHFYYQTYTTFSDIIHNKIEVKIAEIISEILDERFTLTKLFIIICKIFQHLKAKNPNIIKFKDHKKTFKILFAHFESQNLSRVTKIYLLVLKIRLYKYDEVLEKSQYSSLLNKAVKTILQIKSQNLKIRLFSYDENLQIFIHYVLTIDSAEDKAQKQGEVELLLKYAYHQNGAFQTFHRVMQAIVLFYSYGQKCEFQKFIKVFLRGTYFKNRQKKQFRRQMQKFITADYALQQFLTFYKNSKYKKFKSDVFQFLWKGINFEKEEFYKKNGNIILLIEKVFKLYFNKQLYLNASDIIWLLKVSSRFIKYSNQAFSRSFCAAMNYWYPVLCTQSGIKVNKRKQKLIANRLVRNSQFIFPQQFMQSYLNVLEFRKCSSILLVNRISRSFKCKMENFHETNQQNKDIPFFKEKTRLTFYVFLLKLRPVPHYSVPIFFQKIQTVPQ